ncbi:hypothetical protein QCA50_004278 [Cerrena zonata]|uniref:GH10 domain-containing protein n=1 Tax=Cerrena zonata TaxID=2478898 RepID=A0AAW0GNH3_9APHY
MQLLKMLSLLLAVLTFALSVSSAPNARPKLELNTLAKQNHKLYFGTASNNAEFINDTDYRRIIQDTGMFGQLTPAHGMKWSEVEPNPGQFTFAAADQFVQFARGNGQLIRGHNCVWHERLPDWVANGTFTESEILNVVENHCGTLVGRYRGQICK